MARLKKRADGRYQRKLTLKNGKQKVIYAKTLAELNEKEDIIRQQDNDGVVIGDKTTVAAWCEIWLDQYKSTGLRRNSIIAYNNTVRNHIVNIIGDIKLQDLKPVHCTQVMNECSKYSYSLQMKTLVALRALLKDARRNGLISSDPTDGLKVKKMDQPDDFEKYLSKDEAENLIASIENKRAKLFAALCLYCGLRKQEALGLKWTDIEDGCLRVRRTTKFKEDGNIDSDRSLKSPASRRVVPVPEILQAIIDDSEKPYEFVFTKVDGSPMSEKSYVKMFDKVKKLNPNIHAHMLRHTYATMLYHAGVDLRTAQKLLGHSNIQVTANIYTHLEEKDALSTIDLLNNYFKK